MVIVSDSEATAVTSLVYFLLVSSFIAIWGSHVLFRFNHIVCNCLYLLLVMENRDISCLISLTCVVLACSQELGPPPAEEKSSQFGHL